MRVVVLSKFIYVVIVSATSSSCVLLYKVSVAIYTALFNIYNLSSVMGFKIYRSPIYFEKERVRVFLKNTVMR